MSLLQYRKLPDFNPVAAGARASILIPRGPTYEDITLRYAESGTAANEATMKAGIEEVVLKVNGIERFSMTGKHLVDINKFYGLGYNAGELVIPLARPWMKTKEAIDNLAWGTRNMDSFMLEVKLASGATAPTLSADAWVIPESRDLGAIIEVHEISAASSTTGKFEISTLPKGNGDMVAIHLDNANITALEAKINGVPFIDNDTDLDAYHNSLTRRSDGKRTAQTGYVHVDAQHRNRLGDTWPLAQVEQFNINPSLSSAGAVGIIMETLNAPLGVQTTR